jgi:putative transposase
MPVSEICRRAKIGKATQFDWKKKYAGLPPTVIKRLNQLEDENGRLRKLVADLSLEREMLQGVIRRTEGQRSQSSEAWSKARAGGRVSG